jgi:hypothetical protein
VLLLLSSSKVDAGDFNHRAVQRAAENRHWDIVEVLLFDSSSESLQDIAQLRILAREHQGELVRAILTNRAFEESLYGDRFTEVDPQREGQQTVTDDEESEETKIDPSEWSLYGSSGLWQ